MALNRTFTYQQLEDIKIKAYVKGLFDIFGHRSWTKEEWDEVVEREVKVFLDEKQTRAEAAAKARKAAERKKKTSKKKTKKAVADEMDMLLGPRPRGACTRVDTIKGPKMGYSKADGSILFKFPPEDPAERATWPYKSRIKGLNSKYGAKGEMICEGIWCSADGTGKNVEGFIDDALLQYYLLKAPVESKAPVQEQKEEVAEEVVDDDDLGFDLEDDDDDEAQAELAAALKKTDARKKLARICRRVRWHWKKDGTVVPLSPMNMDTFVPCVFAEATIRAAIENRCKDEKDQEKYGRSYEEQKAHWEPYWARINKKARNGLFSNKKLKTPCFKGMTKKQVLDNVFVIAFRRFLKAVDGKVQLTTKPVGKDRLAEILGVELNDDDDDDFE